LAFPAGWGLEKKLTAEANKVSRNNLWLNLARIDVRASLHGCLRPARMQENAGYFVRKYWSKCGLVQAGCLVLGGLHMGQLFFLPSGWVKPRIRGHGKGLAAGK